MTKNWLIYKHTSTVTGKSYIGLTCNSIGLRWQQHCSAAKLGCSTHFARAITKYGRDSWEHEVLESGIDNLDKAKELEIYYIDLYNTVDDGYNITKGGDTGSIEAAEYTLYNPDLDEVVTGTSYQIATKYGLHQGYVRYVGQGKSLHVDGWFLWKGKDHKYLKYPVYSFEHKDYGIETLTLKDMADKYNLSKGNLSMVAYGDRVHVKGWTLVGNQHKLLEEKVPGNAKKVKKFDILTNELVAEYPSIQHAARENNVKESVIRERCNGRCSSNVLNGYSYTY